MALKGRMLADTKKNLLSRWLRDDLNGKAEEMERVSRETKEEENRSGKGEMKGEKMG